MFNFISRIQEYRHKNRSGRVELKEELIPDLKARSRTEQELRAQTMQRLAQSGHGALYMSNFQIDPENTTPTINNYAVESEMQKDCAADAEWTHFDNCITSHWEKYYVHKEDRLNALVNDFHFHDMGWLGNAVKTVSHFKTNVACLFNDNRAKAYEGVRDALINYELG